MLSPPEPSTIGVQMIIRVGIPTARITVVIKIAVDVHVPRAWL